MKKLILTAIAGIITMTASFAQELKPVGESMVRTPNVPTPTNSWHIVAAALGPSIPVGWQIINVEGVIYQGDSVNGWQVYLYNPANRQTACCIVSITYP